MGKARILEHVTPARFVEWRARRYADPVERLKYLRRARGMGAPRDRGRLARVRWSRLAPAAFVALLIMPLPTVSDIALLDELPVLSVDPSPADARLPSVWLVEQSGQYEQYSNGLRVETGHEVAGNKRPYPVYDRETLELLEWRSGPVGILYHTTESNIAPFEPGHNGRLRLLGKYLLDYVRKEKAYHYVIDRFGRVHRVVRESDAANHAGYSMWADGRKLYINLNPSFIGISFESGTEDSAKGPQVNQAQINAARVLTEMLRSKYGIAARDCVTHAQVSVAPPIMRLGNHMDWAAGFPFGQLGLENNYAIANPAVAVFGFHYDADFLKATGVDLWRGVVLGEDEFRQRAAARSLSIAQHRSVMKKRYREIIEALDEVVGAVERTL